MEIHELPCIELLDIRIQDLPKADLLNVIVAGAKGARQLLVCYANVHAFNLAAHDARFKRILQGADILYCDGVGLKLGAKLDGQQLTNRNTAPDWVPELAVACEQADLSLFIVGAASGIAERAANKLRETAPELHIVGVHDGYFDKTNTSVENDAVIQAINRAAPDILIIGFGMPLQEYWIEENRSRLGAKILLPVGGMINYLAGNVYRAPRWITDYGLEWLARLVVEPRRLWRRYVLGNPTFLWRVLRNRIPVSDRNSRS